MPLPAVTDTLDAIAEPLRAAYVEREGKFYLDAEPDAAAAGLKQKNADLVRRLTAAQTRAAVIGDRTPEEVEADLALAAKVKVDKAKAEGDFESLKTQMATENAKLVEKEKAGRTAAEQRLHKLLVTDAASGAIRSVGVEPEVLLPHVTAHLRVFDEDGEPVARVVDAKGNVRIGDAAGTPMTIEQLVETFRANPKFAGVFPASGAAGGGARNTGGSGAPAGAVVITAEEGKDTVKYRAAKAKAEKLGVPFMVQG
jgi:hypothetical protein